MFVIPNQSSVPMAYKQFTDAADSEGGKQNDAEWESRSSR